MGNCTSGKELKVCIDKLHTWILEEIRDIGNYILILKHLELRRWNSNDAKATALYKMLYVKTGHLKIKRAFSQLEIKKFIDSQDSILKLIRNLSGLLQEIEKAEKRIRKWKNFGSALVGLIDSASDIEADRRRGRETVNEIIDDFLEAKKSLNTVSRLAKMMNRKNIPVVKEILDGYFDFFLKADGICSKVAGYAEKIHSETEKTLGTKSIWAEAENNGMSYLNLRRKALLNLKREIY